MSARTERSQAIETHYSELIGVLELLPLLVRETRRRRGMSVRAVSRELKMSDATVGAVEKQTTDPTLSTVIALLEWVSE